MLLTIQGQSLEVNHFLFFCNILNETITKLKGFKMQKVQLMTVPKSSVIYG